MAKLEILAGTTSKLLRVFVQNNSVTTGAGLTGLTSATSGLTAYYIREGASTTTQIVLTSATLGTFTSSGFIVVDGTNMPGVYELGIPNAAITAGAKSVLVFLQGATNMAPVLLEIELTAVDNQSTAYGLSLAKTTNITGFNDIAATAIVSSGAITTSSGAVSTVTTVTNQLTAAAIATGIWTDTTAGDFTTLTSPGKIIFAQLGGAFTTTSSSVFSTASLANAPTGGSAPTVSQIATAVWQDTTAGDFTVASSIGKSLFTSGAVPGAAGGLFIAGTNAATTITTALTTTFTGSLTGSVASVTGAVGSVTGLTASNLDTTVSSRMATYTQPTGFLAATFPTGTVANTTNITAGTITTTTNLTNAPTAGDFTATMKTSLNAATPASVTGAVGSVTGNVGGNVTGSVASVLTGGLIDLTSTAYGEPSTPVAATANLKDMIVWMKTLARNKISQTSTTETLFKDDGTTTISTSTDSDDGTTFLRGKWS